MEAGVRGSQSKRSAKLAHFVFEGESQSSLGLLVCKYLTSLEAALAKICEDGVVGGGTGLGCNNMQSISAIYVESTMPLQAPPERDSSILSLTTSSTCASSPAPGLTSTRQNC